MQPLTLTGILPARYDGWTIRTATGLIAGPERPAVTLETRGVRVSTSMAIPTKVLTSVRPSAPPFSAARASKVMSVTFGESFTNKGRRAARFGAGDVQFVSVNPLALIQDFNTTDVILGGVAEDVHQAARPECAQKGQLFLQEFPCTHVLQADGVQHPRLRFINARRWIARHGLG